MKTCSVMLAFLAFVFTARPALADEFTDRLRAFLELPASAQIVWPPRRELAAGSHIDPSFRVIGSETADTTQATLGEKGLTVTLAPERLLPSDGFWEWRTFLGNAGRINASLNLSEPEIVSLTVTSEEPSATSTRKPSLGALQTAGKIETVQRAWTARISIEITPLPTMASSEWQAMRRETLKDNRFKRTANSIILTIPDKIAIAIEPGPKGREGDAPFKQERVAAPKRWALATIASGRYQFLGGMDQEWNAQSAALVAAAVADWHPAIVRSMKPTDSLGISRAGVLAFLKRFAEEAKAAKTELLVVYYIGHMERTGTGSLSLLMGDAPAVRKIRAPAPQSGFGNLRQVMQIVDQAEAELAPREGSLDVGVIHRQLGTAKLPFVLLVDGCLEDQNFAQARERLGIMVDARGGEPVYVGPGDAGLALREQITRLQAYPEDFPWLKSKDATVLGATPGTLAYAEPHPMWLLGGTVGPIARRLSDVVARTRWDSDRPSLIRVLSFSADRQAVGPQELAGTVSWSDWLPYLRKFDPASFKR